MEPVVATRGLRRIYGRLFALDGIDLEIPAGGVVGLVGPNGSGKSTLIRILLGLIQPTAGGATVLGGSVARPSAYASRVGALVERPAFIGGLSARANLVSLARLRRVPLERVDAVLQMVGLAGRDAEPVTRFSLGMQQRLGIAAALLSDPDLLILDEPTNGLDPAGIVEIRGLLRDLGRQGRTVVVSSHQLSEIEAICDHLVVIRFGKLLYAGSMTELLGRTRPHVDVAPEHGGDLHRLATTLAAAGFEVAPDGGSLRVRTDGARAADLNRAAAEGGITLRSLVVVQDSLEEIFLAMTGSDDRTLAADRADTRGVA